MTDIVQVERVANGYLVRVPAQRTLNGGGVIAGERVYIAASPRDVATILEEVFVEREAEPEVEPPTAPTVEELAAAGLVRRGTDVAAAEEETVERAPVADDGGEYPAVTHQGGRWTMECPNHGAYRAEFIGQVLRCAARENGKRCSVSMPLEAAHRAAGLT